MRKYPMPKPFDGKKFRERYNLTYDEYWSDGDFLYVPDRLPDPPVFEAPGPAPLSTEERLAILEAKTANIPIPVLFQGRRPPQ